MVVTISITNTYPRLERSSSYIVTSDLPSPRTGIDEWMEDVLLPLTGEGLAYGPEHGIYTVEVISCKEVPSMAGRTLTAEG